MESETGFLAYYDGVTKTKAHPCNWTNTKNLLREFTDCKLTFGEIDRAFCQRFVTFILSRVSPNSANVYFGTLKAAINQAVLEGIMQANPGNGIKIARDQLETNYQH